MDGKGLTPSELTKEIKGTFGTNKEAANDIFESFIKTIKDLLNKINVLTKKLDVSSNRITELEQVLTKKEDDINMAQKKSNSLEEIIANLKSELKETKEANSKIKPIEEIGAVTPDVTIKAMDEIIENQGTAMKSLLKYLRTGEGGEEAFKQIERDRIVAKAYKDGLTKAPSVEKNSMN